MVPDIELKFTIVPEPFASTRSLNARKQDPGGRINASNHQGLPRISEHLGVNQTAILVPSL